MWGLWALGIVLAVGGGLFGRGVWWRDFCGDLGVRLVAFLCERCE